MATMDFFRRPLLAGKNISRMALASVRGSVRRHEADGINPFPYFTGVVALQTLNLKVDGVVYNVTLTGPGINTVIADINAVLLANGAAFDADGTLGIRTAVGDSTGSVEVTGGTAAVFLGFDVSNGRIRAANGDITSTPEGRVGNWMGVAFPNKGENLTVESVTRGLSRIAGNSDILYSDISRNDAVVKQVAYTTSDQRLLTISPATQALFISKTFLTSTSDKESLAPYFHLIDQATKQIAKSRVVAVVRGAVIGLPPYANVGAWTGGASVGNVLGQSIVKVPLATIDSIRNGRIIEASAADFTDVIVGDLVQIAGATNTKQWSNNGFKWVVEEKISNTVLAVRPMSKSELTANSVTLNEEQPVLELNTAKTGPEVYGSVAVLTGLFCSHVNVIVDPPIPVGATYDLWAAVPGSLRSATAQATRESLSPIYRGTVSDYVPTENGTLSGLVASQSGANCVVTTGLIRLHGRVYSLPARAFLPGAFADGTNYLYWEESTGNCAISLLTTPWASVLNPAVTTNKGHLIAEVVVAGGVITSVLPVTKVRGENSVPITIGVGGQFPSIEAASLWVQGLVANYSETSSASGSFPHFEFIVVSDLTLSAFVPFGTIPSVTLRGATDSVKLTLGSSYFQIQGKRFELKDLTISSAADSNYLVRVVGASATERVVVRNIKQTAGNLWSVIETTGTGVLNEAQVVDCDLRVSRSVVRGTGSGSRGVDSVRVLRSKFTHVASLAPHIICHGAGASTPWDGDLLVMQDCDFLGGWGSAAGADADPMLVNEAGTHPTVPSQIVIQNIRMNLGNYASANGAVMIKATTANCLIDNFYTSAGKIPTAVDGGTATIVTNSKFLVNPETTTTCGVKAGLVDHCTISHGDTDANTAGGVGVNAIGKLSNSVIGNFFHHGVIVGAGEVEIVGNTISSAAGGTAVDLDACIYVNGASACKIVNNLINVGLQGAGTGLGYGVRFTGTNINVLIEGNHFTLTLRDTSIGSTSGTNSKIRIINNTVVSPDAVTEQGMDISRITEGTVIGNNIRMLGGPGSVALRSGALPGNVRVSNNYLEAETAFTSSGTANLIYEGNHFVGITTNLRGVIEGNYFTGLPSDFRGIISNNYFVANTATGAGNLHGQILGNTFTFVAPATRNDVTGFSGRFEGNSVTGHVFSEVTVETSLEFVGNTVTGNLDISDGATAFTRVHIVSNTIGGDAEIENPGASWSFSDNYVAGVSSLRLMDNIEMSGNRMVGAVTLTADKVYISSSYMGSLTMSGSDGLVSSSSLGTIDVSFTQGSLSGCKILTGIVRKGIVTGCHISGSTNFTLGANAAGTDDLVFSGNYCGGPLILNPGSDQRVTITGNTLRPGSIGDSLAALIVQRGSGIMITGNTINGIPLGIEVGSVAEVKDIVIANNNIHFQTLDARAPSETFTITDVGGVNLPNGTYRYLIIVKYTVGGHASNFIRYSKSALSNSLTVSSGGANGIHLAVVPFTLTFAPSHGLSYTGTYEVWRTNDAGVTWAKHTAGTLLSILGAGDDFGPASVTFTPGTPETAITTNNTNNRPGVRFTNALGARVLGNMMFKKLSFDTEDSFIVVGPSAGGVLIGDNNFTGMPNGITDDGNAGVGDNDTYWTANPTTTYAEAGNVGSGGVRE